jgi:hypothetical protein
LRKLAEESGPPATPRRADAERKVERKVVRRNTRGRKKRRAAPLKLESNSVRRLDDYDPDRDLRLSLGHQLSPSSSWPTIHFIALGSDTDTDTDSDPDPDWIDP